MTTEAAHCSEQPGKGQEKQELLNKSNRLEEADLHTRAPRLKAVAKKIKQVREEIQEQRLALENTEQEITELNKKLAEANQKAQSFPEQLKERRTIHQELIEEIEQLGYEATWIEDRIPAETDAINTDDLPILEFTTAKNRYAKFQET